MANVYINKKERMAVGKAWHFVNELLEGYTGDEDTEVYKDLQSTLDGLASILASVLVSDLKKEERKQ